MRSSLRPKRFSRRRCSASISSGAVCANRLLRQRDLANLVQEPRIHPGQPRHLAHAHAALERKPDVAQPLRLRRHQHLRQPARLQHFGPGLLAGLERAPRLHQRFLEGAADGHHFAHGLHLRAQRVVGSGKLFELPLGNLHDDVVDGRLEARRRLARNVVGNLIERVAHRQLGRDLGDRKSRRLRRQRRRTRHARIHLDHGHAAVRGIHRELHVRPARLHADLAHHAIAASRIFWYSRSVSVCAGATVIESPVCTPIGSKFSIEQMMMTLSARSRITSSSYSFQPSTLSSIRHSCTGERSRPRARISISSSRL